MKNMKELFSPMAEQLVRKAKHLEMLAEKNEDYLQQMAALKKEMDPEKRKQLLEDLDKLFNPEPLLGFASRRVDQWQFQLASTYADTFVSKGKYYMNLYYVCCAGLGGFAENKCLRVLPAKVWRPKSGDPLDPKGWDCIDCYAGYRAGWGCLCEILAPGMKRILYARTEVPDKHVNDVRAMYHEDTLKPSSAQ